MGVKMLPKTSKNSKQLNLFQPQLRDMLDSNDPLITLSNAIDWNCFEKEFAKYYSNKGRPAKSIRLMVGLLPLKLICQHLLGHIFKIRFFIYI